MQPSAHATTLNFDEVSFKEHGVSVLPSSKIISSLCVCTTAWVRYSSVNVYDRQYKRYIHSTFTNQVFAKRRPVTQFRALIARNWVLDHLLANSGCPKNRSILAPVLFRTARNCSATETETQQAFLKWYNQPMAQTWHQLSSKFCQKDRLKPRSG